MISLPPAFSQGKRSVVIANRSTSFRGTSRVRPIAIFLKSISRINSIRIIYRQGQGHVSTGNKEPFLDTGGREDEHTKTRQGEKPKWKIM